MDGNFAIGSGIFDAIRNQIDAGDAGIGQAAEFASIGHAVAIRILPHAKFGEVSIICVKHAILIAVIFGSKALKVGEAVAAKDDFRTIVDQVIAVAVNGEKAIISANPSGAFGVAVAGIIEGHARSGGKELCAIAVEVKDDGGSLG